MVDAVFPSGVPPRIQRLIRPSVADALVEDFKVGPILAFGPVKRPPRVAVSDQGEPDAWTATVGDLWPGDSTRALLALATPGVRRMIDSDGLHSAEIYLDDLQDHAAIAAAEALRPPEDTGPVMCLTASVPSGLRSLITRHETPPFHYLRGTLAEQVAELVDLGAAGIWGLRWRNQSVSSVVWVSEARWTGTAAQATAIALQLGAPASWHACMDALSTHGLEGYPDAIELLPDGSADVTVGVIHRRQ